MSAPILIARWIRKSSIQPIPHLAALPEDPLQVQDKAELARKHDTQYPTTSFLVSLPQEVQGDL